ncbi:hypothetical protein EON65_42290, partial [archaeon]
MVCWDVRIPHANSLFNHKGSYETLDEGVKKHDGHVYGDGDGDGYVDGHMDPHASTGAYGVREVVYIGLLPPTPLNTLFTLSQLEAYRRGRVVGGS